MTRTVKLCIGILVVILIGGGTYFFFQKESSTTYDDALIKTDERITLQSPKPYEVVTSPLTLQGEARGYWFFEASFPLQLIDASGKVLATTYAQANGEWMTENFVPFTATFEFLEPTTELGTLILKRDNPSGLPEHDASIQIPVRLK